MPLDTQTFAISAHWLATALSQLPVHPSLFTPKSLRSARQMFLAGANQLTAIKNWLSCADIIELSRGKAELTKLGKAMAAHDESARKAWTWWLFHIHLASNPDSFPYCDFFTEFATDAKQWLSTSEIVESIHDRAQASESAPSASSIGTYFQGVDNAFRPGTPLHGLRLVERRVSEQDKGARPRWRRTVATPSDAVVTYAALLLQFRHFSYQTTVETRELIDVGLGRIVGLQDRGLREALERIHHSLDLSRLVQYRRTVNLDSVQYMRQGLPALHELRVHAYENEGASWT